jgi:hypothetical protein
VETRSESVQIWGGIDAQGGLTLQYEFDSNPALTGIENGPTYTGLGYLGDSGNDASNDTVEFALSTGAGSRVIMWNLVARR